MKTPISLTLSTLFLAAALLPAGAGTPNQPTRPPMQDATAAPATPDAPAHGAPKVTIPELTEVPVVLKNEIQGGGNRIGNELLFFVSKDIFGPAHTLLIARGTPVVGQIVESPTPHSGKMAIRCDYILAWDKTHIPLRGPRQEGSGSMQKTSTAVVGITDANGVIVDQVSNSKVSRVPAGKTYQVYVNADTQTEAPQPDVMEDGGAPREAFALLKDGDWAIGLVRQVGKFYILTNSGGTQTVRISDVRSLEYLKDAGAPQVIR